MNVKVSKSKIEGAGKGLFTSKPFKKGELIGLAHKDGQPVGDIGKMHNHSEEPTAFSVKLGNKRFIYANADLKPGEEITTNYRMQPELEQPDQFKKGGSIPKMPKKKNAKAYSRSIEATNRFFTENRLFEQPKSRKNKIYDPNAKYYQDGGSKLGPISLNSGKYAAKKYPFGKFSGVFKKQNGGEPTSPEEWVESIKAVEREVGNPSGWTYDDFSKVQGKLYEYKDWRSQHPEVIDLSNKPNEYEVPLPKQLNPAAVLQKGGELPEDYSEFESFAQTLPSNLQDPDFEYGNPDQYNLYGMWEAVGKPQSFQDVQDSDYFPLQDDGSYHGFTVGSDGEFLKPMSHSTTWKEVMNAQLNTDPYFKENRLIKNEQGRLQYVPNKQKGGFHDDINKRRQVLRDWTYGKSIGMLQEPDGGYIELDLSEEEMDQYRKGGYIVEDVSIPTLTKAEYGMPMGTGMSQNYMGNTRTFYQTGGKTVPKFQSGSEKDKKKLITYKTDAKLIDGTAAFDLISKVPISADYNQQIKDRLYSGKWGFDPNTGALVKLNKSQQATIPKETEKILLQQKNTQIKKEQDKEYLNSIKKAGYDPETFAGGYLPNSPEFSQYVKRTTPRTFEELKHSNPDTWTQEEKDIWSREGFSAVVNNPAFETVAYFTPPGMAIGAIQGAANLIPDLYAGDYEYAALDAASMLPFAKPIANTVKSAVQNTYKINPWAFKPNSEAYYRVLGKEGVNDALESGIIRANPKNIDSFSGAPIYDRPFFSKGVPFDRDWKSPFKNKKGKQSVGSIYPDETMVEVFGHDKFHKTGDLVTSPIDVLNSSDEGINFYKRDWLKGYKEVPKPQSAANTPVRSGLGGMDMSRYEVKNPDYYTQLLGTYSSKNMSPSRKKFYEGLIASIKKQDGLVSERQYNELQRLKTGNFDFGKKAYQEGGSIELELTPEEIEEYKKGGYIVEDISVPSLNTYNDGGVMTLELTPKEIEDYKRKGYIVEEY